MTPRSLYPLHVPDSPSDVACETVEPPADNPIGLAAIYALEDASKTRSCLRAARLILVRLPDGYCYAPIIGPTLDRLALSLGGDIAGAFPTHAAGHTHITVHTSRLLHDAAIVALTRSRRISVE